MLNRRSLLAVSLSTAIAVPARAAPDSFPGFLAGMRAEARRAGISAATLDRAFAGVQPNQKVIERDRHQPEFTLTWAQYRALLITDQRIANGRAAYQQNRALLASVRERFGVDPGVITGIWGLESSFGAGMGDFHVVEALATLAWEGRRASFFRGELIAALRILDHGDVTPGAHARLLCRRDGPAAVHAVVLSALRGRFRGPRPARHLDQQARRARLDRQLSRAVRLARRRSLGPAGDAVRRLRARRRRPRQPPTGRRMGCGSACAPADGRPLARPDVPAAVVLPDGAGGEAFLVYANFAAIRRYNPSDFYALAVGLLGDRCRRVRLAFSLLLALLAASCHRPPPTTPHYVLGAPYQAGGVWYYPRESYDGQETGLAIVYAADHADLTADGEAFDQTALAAAHQTLQLPGDRASDQPGERPAGGGAHQRPRPRNAASADRGHPPHRDAAALPRRCARCACGWRCCRRKATPRWMRCRARRSWSSPPRRAARCSRPICRAGRAAPDAGSGGEAPQESRARQRCRSRGCRRR